MLNLRLDHSSDPIQDLELELLGAAWYEMEDGQLGMQW